MSLQQFKNLSSWKENNITIKPRETYTLDFIETTPNMFVVINTNLALLKISIGSIPTENHYEFKVEYNTTETLGRPTPTTKLYILNDSDLTVNVKIFSIFDVFNLEILKNLTVNLENYTIETNSEISGVKEGVNIPVTLDGDTHSLISAIEVYLSNMLSTSTSDNYTNLKNLLEVLNQTYNRLSVLSAGVSNNSNTLKQLIENNEEDGYTNLYKLLSVLEEIRDKEITVSGGSSDSGSGGSATDLTEVESKLTTIYSLLTNIDGYLSKWREETSYPEANHIYLNNVTTFSYYGYNDETVHFDWLFNDGADATIYLIDVDGNKTDLFTMYEGEAFTDLEIRVGIDEELVIESDTPLFRIKYWTYLT